MKDINDYEVEISLSDILLHCLNHWKSILIVVLAGVMLYSAYTYFAGRNVKSPNYTASEILSAERSTELLSDRVAYLEKFHKESNLMRIDPHKLYQATVSYIITLPQDEWEGVSNLLYTFVTYGKLLRQLEEKQDRYTAIELSHLIGIVDQQENEHISTLALTASVSKSISISMYDATEEDAEQMLALVSDEFTKYVNELKNYYTIEAIAIITPVICEADSSELAAYQKYMKTELENEQTDYKKSITALEEMRTQESTAIFSFKQILIISFTCGGLMIFLWCLVYVFGGKLYSVADLQTKYGIKLLGNINQSANKGIAKWVAQKRWGLYASFPLPYQKELVLTNIRHEISKEKGKKSILIASSLDEDISEIAAFLKMSLEEEGYVVNICNNVTGQLDILKSLYLYDNVVILENMERSRNVLVNEELKILREHIGNVIGLITFE